MSPKGLCIESLVPYYWEVVEEMRPSRRSLGHWRCILEGESALSLFLFSFGFLADKVSGSAALCVSSVICCPTIVSKQWGQAVMD